MVQGIQGVNVETFGVVTLIQVCGALKLGETTLDELRRCCCELAKRDLVHLVLDLQGVPAIDSTGIGVIMQAYTSTRNRGGQCKLMNLARMPEEVLRVVGVLKLFEVYHDLNAALTSFGRAA